MRYKNSDLVPQIFLAVVGVIFVGIIIYYTINSLKSSTRVADAVIAGVEDTASEFAEYSITMYDGEEIMGSEVVNFIKKNLGDYSSTETAPIYVEVVVKNSGTTYTKRHSNKTYIKETKNFSNVQYYIKPTALFAGEVIRNQNKVIIGVKFTQK